MRVALLIYKYFPYGGLQRDMRRVAQELCRRGHQCIVYCGSWQGEDIPGVEVRRVAARGFSNHSRNAAFQRRVALELQRQAPDIVLGFDKMPGLDLYFAGDVCFREKAAGRGAWYRRSSRFRHFAAAEQAVFGPDSGTRVLLLTEPQRAGFAAYYNTPDSRLVMLPPGVEQERRAPQDAAARRKAMRGELALEAQELTLLFVASSFATKGLDRVITALAHMATEQPSVTARLLVVGVDRPRPYRRLARRLEVADRVTFLGGREDVGELMLAADLLVHPARTEAGGLVLLEAIVAGLPVVTTANCGYATYVAQARAGIVLEEPFAQPALDGAVMRFIDGIFRADCRESALRFANLTDLYALPGAVADAVEAAARG